MSGDERSDRLDAAMERLYGSFRDPLLPMLLPARRETIEFPRDLAAFDGEACPAWAQTGDRRNRMAVHVPGPAAVHCVRRGGHDGPHVAADRPTIVPRRRFRAWVWEDDRPVAPQMVPARGSAYGLGRVRAPIRSLRRPRTPPEGR